MKKDWLQYRNIREFMNKGITEEHKRFARVYARKVKHIIDDVMAGMNKEADETREMANSFFRLLEHKLNLNDRSDPPTKEEVKAAIEQLEDVGRFSLFVTAIILPGGVISLIGLELLAKRFGVKNFRIVPSSFRKNKQKTSRVKDQPDTS